MTKRTLSPTCAHGHNDWRYSPSGRRRCATCNRLVQREFYARIERNRVCRLIEKERVIPAVYDYEPLLSAEEEASLA